MVEVENHLLALIQNVIFRCARLRPVATGLHPAGGVRNYWYLTCFIRLRTHSGAVYLYVYPQHTFGSQLMLLNGTLVRPLREVVPS